MYRALPEQLCVRDSNIAGQGIFAKTDIPTGTYLGMSHIVEDEIIYRTPLGGFLNHSNDPNCVKYYEDGKYFVKTIREIKSGDELFLKYTFYSVES
tara:strand:- start:366 stop:653 length:288 start_codon:yes stop_codon:yes gene_type:complete